MSPRLPGAGAARASFVLAMAASGGLWAWFAGDARLVATLVVPAAIAACVPGAWSSRLPSLQYHLLVWSLAFLAGGTFAAISLRLHATR